MLQPESSGSRLFDIAAEGFNLLKQLGGAAIISAAHRHSEGEFQFLQLMPPLDKTSAGAGGRNNPSRAKGSTRSTREGVGVCHGWLSFYFDTSGQDVLVFQSHSASGGQALHRQVLITTGWFRDRFRLAQQVLTLLQDQIHTIEALKLFDGHRSGLLLLAQLKIQALKPLLQFHQPLREGIEGLGHILSGAGDAKGHRLGHGRGEPEGLSR
jgi:hypothetical protein